MTSTQPRVLLFEYDSCIREALAECIASLGIEVARADDGGGFLAALRSGPAPMAVLVNMRARPADDRDVLEEMRKDPRTAAIPVISLAARQDPVDPPVYCQLQRPFDLDEIARALVQLQHVEAARSQ